MLQDILDYTLDAIQIGAVGCVCWCVYAYNL